MKSVEISDRFTPSLTCPVPYLRIDSSLQPRQAPPLFTVLNDLNPTILSVKIDVDSFNQNELVTFFEDLAQSPSVLYLDLVFFLPLETDLKKFTDILLSAHQPHITHLSLSWEAHFYHEVEGVLRYLYPHPGSTTRTPLSGATGEKINWLELRHQVASRIPTISYISFGTFDTRGYSTSMLERIKEKGPVKGICMRIIRDEGGGVLMVEELHGPNNAAGFERMKTTPPRVEC